MASQELPSQKPTPAWKSPWVIAWVFMVFAVLAMNLFMVFLAIKTNPGLVNEDFYEQGQRYARTLVSKKARDPGWHFHMDVPEALQAGQPVTIRFFLTDRAGQPVQPDGKVRFFAYRPSDAREDFNRPMLEEGIGRYRVELVFPRFGIWDTLVSVQHGEDEYNLGRRIQVARPQ